MSNYPVLVSPISKLQKATFENFFFHSKATHSAKLKIKLAATMKLYSTLFLFAGFLTNGVFGNILKIVCLWNL